MPTVYRSLVVALAALLSACAQHIYSPPARGMPLESSRPLAPGQNAVMLEGGGSGAVFGPDLVVGSLRYRRGLIDKLEGSAELSLLRVTNDGDTTTHRNAYALRAGAKYAPVKWVGLIGGLGGGGHDAGGFFSPDLGVLVSGENRYIVPTLSMRAFVSQPISAERVDLGSADEGDDDGVIERANGEPRFSYGFALGSGLRVPLAHSDALTHALYAGFTITHIADDQKKLSVFGLGAGAELVF